MGKGSWRITWEGILCGKLKLVSLTYTLFFSFHFHRSGYSNSILFSSLTSSPYFSVFPFLYTILICHFIKENLMLCRVKLHLPWGGLRRCDLSLLQSFDSLFTADFHFQFFIYLFLCARCYPSMYTCAWHTMQCPWMTEGIVSQKTSYRWLWATRWVLGIESETSRKASSALNH